MKVIVAGSREFNDRELLDRTMRRLYGSQGIIVLSGMARGADTLGKEWAEENGVVVDKHPADWDRYGKSAGPIRNREMAKEADALVAFWDGKSVGTKHMINCALLDGLEVHVIPFCAATP